MGDGAEKEFKRAQRAMDAGQVLAALAAVEKGLKLRDDAHWYSLYGYSMAKERGHLTRGLELCTTAIAREPDYPQHYFYLAQLHLVAARREEALQALRQGMSLGGTPAIARLLEEIGTRKPSVFPFLSRDNPLNKYLGLLFSRLGLR
ncbi:hypothetical protein [Trichlorobacter ammonificans]|uniref:TPR_REGION domain-containing protein n=1 Tax=Trichlorobacter ammonificans TaxID=2916410 RepID=A0ABM9D8S9_9BACT|nr:hypothetical protein [Trichlorobacter ammonificans]CAH2031519.1 TPR_REGION domain-containing protein [Trichlorobacter ammonificans]